MASIKELVRASLDFQGIPAPQARVGEIAVEAERLTKGLSGHMDRLSYQDEPSHFAVLLMREAIDE